MEKVLEGKEKRDRGENTKFTWNNYILPTLRTVKVSRISTKTFPLAQVPGHRLENGVSMYGHQHRGDISGVYCMVSGLNFLTSHP